MLIKYLPTYRKLDSINGVGLWWEPGQVRNVSPEMAEKLLPYTDTWAKTDENAPVLASEAIPLKQAEKPVEEPLPVIDFHGMNKKALIEFAETKYNERLDKRQNEESIRHKVIALFSKNEMEQR
ncbi:MAG TPA: hypothetical protein VFS89_03845 [Nitrosospira sp.]|nr:hypothetical protein [Nitrosospira sp.]